MREEITDQAMAMIHDLRMDIGSKDKMRFDAYPGWTINDDTKAAIYAKGFYNFLEDAATFAQVLKEIEV
ncbi:hypothetical protein [Pseudomonas sp. NPDC087639]|uniref:hypothetical protein n=1 Tax=Pseudomonas sp. NPDC087639 TaxID=3364445 RepID=UPI003830EFC8